MNYDNFNTKYNGRVNIENNTNKPFYTFQENKETSFLPYKKQAISHITSRSALSDAFFSESNQKIVQNQLRYRVWIATEKQFVIGEQSYSELQLIMRSIYFQYSKNLNYSIKEQIEELNNKVLEYAVDKVVSNLLQYMRYKQDISQLPIPREYPEQVSMKGTRCLTMPNFF